MITACITLGSAYLLGSIPFGLLITRLFSLQDPRTHGSQNIGATNVLRSGHKLAAFLTLLFDGLKGSSAVWIAVILAPQLVYEAGLLAIIGHIFPLWLGFKGGKGIATALGVILALNWPLALLCLVTWASVMAVTRYSSLASLSAVSVGPVYALVTQDTPLLYFTVLLACFLFWTHRGNIKRLRQGEEPKVGTRTKDSSS